MTTSNITFLFADKQMTGYGNWTLTGHFSTPDGPLTLSAHTTNARIIDEWYDEDGNINQDTMADIKQILLEKNGL